ncbi:MAG TPA: Xaa-Pro peptidase family protein, partial [Thermomicrobiales bacterium]|nr:Xaa-Pro peptidase family protein [Thermomicrobiales bacterium]
MPKLSLSDAEYRSRRQSIFARTADKLVDAFVFFDPNNVSYLSRFVFVTTERPMAYILTPDRSILFVPRMEVEHATEVGLVDEVISYPEYPGKQPPLEVLAAKLRDLGLGNAMLGIDGDGYGRVYGYRGPRLSALLPDATLIDVLDEIEYMQMINSPEEIELMREACKWGDLAQRRLQEFTAAGLSEIDIADKATVAASAEMTAALGRDFRPRTMGGSPAFAGFGGAIGVASSNPHALNNNAILQVGDTLITWGASSVWGYSGELERTMILGEPSAEQERFFNLMVDAQTLAIDALCAGQTCASVDREVLRFYAANDLMPYWRHHSGHAKSTLIHEAPFLDE